LRALLDTHTFIWAATEDRRISSAALDLIADGSNQLVFSVVSGWEIAIKFAAGRLDLPDEPRSYLASHIPMFALDLLPIALDHALQVGGLPHHHRDPFDRLLIAQAQVEQIPILTSDPNIARYDVEIIW
jgi:PIN domain nuclease of toxin-antitoxin system